MDDIKLIQDPQLGLKLLEFKQKFGRLFLFYKGSIPIIFRPLTISECETIYHLNEYVDSHIIDEWIVTKTILSNTLEYLLGNAPAGLVSSLAAAIVKKSTIDDVKVLTTLMDQEREEKKSIANVLDSMVKIVLATKDSKDITYHQQVKYAVLAEDITGKKLELVSQTLPKNLRNRRLPPDLAAMLSKEAADRPDITRDNAQLAGL